MGKNLEHLTNLTEKRLRWITRLVLFFGHYVKVDNGSRRNSGRKICHSIKRMVNFFITDKDGLVNVGRARKSVENNKECASCLDILTAVLLKYILSFTSINLISAAVEIETLRHRLV